MKIINKILLACLFVVILLLSSLQDYLFMKELVISGFVILVACTFKSVNHKKNQNLKGI
ncbi:hypothetical protein [Aquimarina sp. LLG6339-5]|uniref:hypothetical protein n=1 Tax=Aquimarina sp. LLG6339-5 TaxID=3160830 RepID=UPI00386AF883